MDNLPGFEIKPVVGDGMCTLSSFSTALTIVTGVAISLEDVISRLRKELLTKYEFYKQFSSADVNILSELEKFLESPLNYYNTNSTDLFLAALGNAFQVNVIVLQADENLCWLCDLSNNANTFTTTLHFARSLSPHIDPIVPTLSISKVEPSVDRNDDEVIFLEFVEGKNNITSPVVKQEPVTENQTGESDEEIVFLGSTNSQSNQNFKCEPSTKLEVDHEIIFLNCIEGNQAEETNNIKKEPSVTIVDDNSSQAQDISGNNFNCDKAPLHEMNIQEEFYYF